MRQVWIAGAKSAREQGIVVLERQGASDASSGWNLSGESPKTRSRGLIDVWCAVVGFPWENLSQVSIS